MPLISYMDMPSFKIYMSDVGLLGARCNLDAITLLEGNGIEFQTICILGTVSFGACLEKSFA